MDKIILATSNGHKRQEFADMMPAAEILTLRDLPVPVTIVEDGKTFAENALKKARAVYQACHLPVLADDSGLEVDCLDRFPGVYSARWMGEDTSYEIKNQELIRLVDGKDRTCRYVCAIAYIGQDGQEIVVEGAVEGRIADKPAGSHGFGYDPVFYYPPFEATFGEVDESRKHAVSHRGKALEKLLEAVPGLV